MHALTYIKLLLTAIFWGGTFIAARAIANHIDAFSAAFLRFTIASATLLAVVWKMNGGLPKLHKNQILPIFLLGMTGIFAYNFCFFKGLQFIGAGRAALIVATNPIFITLLAAVFFREKLSWTRMFGIVLSVFGAVVVITRGSLSAILNNPLGQGELYIFGCVLSWVAYSLIGKRLMNNLSPLIAVSYSSVVGTIALFIPAYFHGVLQHLSHYSALDWTALAYLGLFGTVLGFLWYYQGIKSIGPSKASQFINFVPISAIILAYFILDEAMTFSLFAGAVLVITGVYLTNSNFGLRFLFYTRGRKATELS